MYIALLVRCELFNREFFCSYYKDSNTLLMYYQRKQESKITINNISSFPNLNLKKKKEKKNGPKSQNENNQPK